MPATADSPPSGRFVLRVDQGLHARLRDAARDAGMSLNEYCARTLAAPLAGAEEPTASLIARATSMFGAHLVGIVAYGSWARDELTVTSDLDVLIIVSSDVTLTRDLYRSWDAAPMEWDSRVVDPRIAHLPAPDDRVPGFWAEVALDGIVLFERGFEVSRALAAIRRRIASGELVRGTAHGQPYWTERR